MIKDTYLSAASLGSAAKLISTDRDSIAEDLIQVYTSFLNKNDELKEESRQV